MNNVVIFLTLIGVVAAACLIEQWFETAERKPARRTRWPANLALLLINSGLLAAIPISTISAAEFALSHEAGFLNRIAEPYWVTLLITVLCTSLVAYVIHRLFHHVPILWRLHKVHHSDDMIDGSSGFRHHPVEVVASALVLSGVAFAMGLDPATLVVLAFAEPAFAILTHIGVYLPKQVDRWLALVFVTPSVHLIHHSDAVVETDTNYGVIFTIWDHLFGTFRQTPVRPPDQFQIGLRDVSSGQARDLDELLIGPWRNP